MSELILTLKGLPQKQYILNNSNKHEVKLTLENNNWTVVKAMNSYYETQYLLFGLALLLIVALALKSSEHINSKEN